MLGRLRNSRSIFSQKEMEKDHDKQQQLVQSICDFPASMLKSTSKSQLHKTAILYKSSDSSISHKKSIYSHRLEQVRKSTQKNTDISLPEISRSNLALNLSDEDFSSNFIDSGRNTEKEQVRSVYTNNTFHKANKLSEVKENSRKLA